MGIPFGVSLFCGGGGTAYPSGGRGFSGASGRSAPLPRLPGGGPHFSREMGRKRAGGKPPGPRVYGPLAVARSFWGSFSLIRSRGYSLRYAKTDLGRIFEKKYAEKHFCERKSPNQGTYMGFVIAYRPFRCAPPRQNERASSERAMKLGVQGAPPPALFPPAFSGESRAPARSRAGNLRRRC